MGRSVEDARAGYVVVGGSGVLAPLGAAVRARHERGTSISRGSRVELGDWDERVALDARDPDAVGRWLAGRNPLPHCVIAYSPATSPEAFARLAEHGAVAVLVVPTAWSDPDVGAELAGTWHLPDTVRVLRLGWTGDVGAPRWHTPEEISAAALALALDPGSSRLLGRTRPWADRPGSPSPVVRDEPWPATTGVAGLAQGVYGDVGNLELVAADAGGDGIWVGWWNADAEDHASGAVPGSWSGAKRFADGRRYVAVTITQAQAGPSFLEVLAHRADGGLDRLVWTPDEGFTDQGTLLDGVVAAAPVVIGDDGDHWVVATTAHGPVVLRGHPDAPYPALDLERVGADDVPALAAVPGGATVVGAAWHTDHLDLLAVDEGTALWCCGRTKDTIAVATSGAVTTGSVAAQGDSIAAVLCAAGRAVLVLPARSQAPVDDLRVDLGPADHATVAAVRLGEDRTPQWHVVTSTGSVLIHHRVGEDGRVLGVHLVVARAWTSPDRPSLHGHL